MKDDGARYLGFLGGSFDPIHNGHLHIALTTKKQCQLDALYLLPCGQPVIKNGLIASTEQRLAMLQEAIVDYPDELFIDTTELERNEPSYTLNTLKILKQKYPNDYLIFIMGMDVFNDLEQWHRYDNLLNYAHLIIADRAHFSQQSSAFYQSHHGTLPLTSSDPKIEKHCIYHQPLTPKPLSSSLIRHLIHTNQPLGDKLPERVKHYILQQKLYE